VHVVAINQPHAHTRSRRGKDDAIDAEAAAQRYCPEKPRALRRTPAASPESIRQLMVARDGAVKARTAALGQLGDLIITAPVPLREKLARFCSEASFAHLCGVAPLPASSGRTTRHRLNHGGNRQANRALHMIVIVRLRYCSRTQAYRDRRIQEGKTNAEVIRCLKRYVVRELLRTISADLGTLAAAA
jgi:transposase